MQHGKRIGELLTEQGVITQAQLQEALTLQTRREGRICQILMSLGYLTADTLLECLGAQDVLTPISPEPYVIDPALMTFVPREFAVQHEVLPLERRGAALTVAVAGSPHSSTPFLLEQSTGFAVREVLCARGVVRNAIDQYYGLSALNEPPPWVVPADGDPRVDLPDPISDPRDWGGAARVRIGPEAVRLKNLLLIIESLERFPLLPEVHLRLLEQLDDPNVQLSSLHTLIGQDPMLAANVLRLANTAAHAAHGGLDSIERACVFLGVRQLRNLALASAVFQHLSARAEFDLTHTFRVANQCGLLTKIICDITRFGDRDAAFTAGLLADLGQIALRLFSEEYVALIEASARAMKPDSSYLQRSRTLVQMEESVLGASASELGYQLACHWNLPDVLAETIRFHDRLERPRHAPALATVVGLARYCLQHDSMTGGFGDPTAEPELAWLLTAVGSDAGLLPEIESRYREAAGTDAQPLVASG